MTTLDKLLPAGGPLAAALSRRSEILRLTEASGAAVLTPSDPGGLPHALRLALAVRAAQMLQDAALAGHYQTWLDDLPDAQAYAPLVNPKARPKDTRLAAIVRHADRLARDPKSSTRADILALGEAGVAEADIVRLSELSAFLAYEARILAGFRLLEPAT